MKKIFIWGCYWQGNFGDDLMAIMIARHFIEKGYDVRVFRLENGIADHYGIPTFSQVAEGVSWSDIVLLGGGAFLQGIVPLKYKLLSTSMRDIYKELNLLHKALKFYCKKLVFCSIGSSGVESFDELDPVVKKIFNLKTLVGGSVRLPSDLDLLSRLPCKDNTKFIPDILFSTYLTEVNRQDVAHSVVESRRFKIGVNISKRDRKTIEKILTWHSLNKDKVDLVFLLTHSKTSGISSEYYYQSDNVISEANYDPLCFAQTISGFDLIVSVKLHLGLVAMSSGVEFVSFNGQKKTVAQLNLLNRGDCILQGSHVELINILNDFISKKMSLRGIDSLLQSNIESSVEHLSYIEKLVETS